ncbi:MAG: FHA domain-containing protein [Planctomycetota bacterium]|nr:MAG: FHA domain-containing protein [Planctomycetota bacterium]REK28346.1 MAG: FHA domain-containing protein [Planctomycetota bacterium]REK38822.1 MAG: FHA domain-containing protein [Planctomycetota bacterium]
MPQQTWIIGSGPDCDLVVDNSAVSSRHCRLEADGDTLTLHDLDSTNGTFVNGEQLTASRVVTTDDQITLGQSQPMPWPQEIKPTPQPAPRSAPKGPQQQAITVGRAAGNDVVLNEAHVSSQHARLTITGDDILLEDLGSTNGTAVGNVENKISRATVKPGDTVYFGSAPYTVSDLLSRAQASPRTVQAGETASGRIVPIAVVLGVVLLGLVVWIAFPDRAANDGADDPSPALAENEPDEPPAVAEVNESNTTDAPPEDALTDEERLAHALFVVVCSNSARHPQFRVGTAFAVDEHHLATTASVIRAMEDLQQNGYEQAFLYSPPTQQELPLLSTHVHPEYTRANQEARAAQQRHDDLIDNLESDPPDEAALEALKQQLLASRVEALDAIDRQTVYDVAVIEVESPLAHWLSGAPPETTLRPNLRLTVTGLAFDLEDPFFNPNEPLEPHSMTSRVRQLVPGESAQRLLAGATKDHLEYAYLGSPALNAQGEVVAVYARPTPPAPDADEAEPPDTFDAPLFERIRECLTHAP